MDSGVIQFEAGAALQKRFGEELIKDPQTTFFELTKNSFDANATEVFVGFSVDKKSLIIIQDDGNGMALNDLKTKWVRAGGENNEMKFPYLRADGNYPEFKNRYEGLRDSIYKSVLQQVRPNKNKPEKLDIAKSS